MNPIFNPLRKHFWPLARVSAILLSLTGLAAAQSWTGTDIGSVGLAGTDSYSGGVYTISGSGSDIFGTADAFHYVYQMLPADGELTARVASLTNYTNTWAKVGVMVRQSTAVGDVTAFLAVSAGNGINFFQRTSLNGTMTSSLKTSTAAAPYWVKVVKDGTLITMYQSPDGVTWTFAAQTRLTSLTSPVTMGFAVCSHDNTTRCTATFDNITLTAQTTFAPAFPWHDQDIGSPGQAGQVHVEQYLWSLYGGGNGITGTADSFHYAYQSLSGNGVAIAQVNGLNGSTTSAGVIMRQDLTASSIEASVLLNATSGVGFATRSTSGGTVTTVAGASVAAPYWVKLVRAGSIFYGYQSSDGNTWTLVSSQTISMTGTIYVGVGATSKNNGTLALGVLDDVYIIPTGNYLSSGTISSGSNHNLYLQSNGTVWAWGLNTSGQVGDGTTTTRTSPVQLTTLSGIESIEAGASHSLALKNDGTVWDWGDNTYGQLGDGTLTQHTTPEQLTTLSGIMAVSAGSSHSLALKNDGTVWAWGNNANGQLGDGTTTSHTSPEQLTTLSGIVAISAGGSHSVALKADGTVWVWGYNSTGQLGDGTTTQHTSPEQLTSLSNMAFVSAGFSHSVVLNDDGTIWAWGDNSAGEVGDGTTTQRNSPVHLTTLSSMIAVQASNLFSVALKSDGTVWTWGKDSSGQLGNNSTTQQNSPVQVSGLTGVLAISAGTSDSVAITSDNAIHAWGDNSTGQLGNGTTTSSLVPLSLNPVITSSSSASASTGSAFSYTITATNSPTSYIETGILPAGLTFSGNTISGTPTATGTFPVTISAANVSGTGSATLTITVSTGSSGSWTGIDIGSVGLAGSDSYNSSTGVYTISGSGTDIFSTADAFHYVYQTLGGDGQLIARVATITNYTTTWAKVGLMLRQSTAAGDITALLVATAGNGIDFFQRTTLNGTMTSSHQTSTSTAPYWLKVVKAGTVITFYQSPDGATWTQAAQTTLTSLTSPVDIGFAVCSHDNTTLCTGTFDNILLTGGSGGAAPVITSSTTGAGTTGSAFSYTIAASNSPTSYGESGTLPAGLTFSGNTISGTPTATGTFPVTISATNGTGTGSATLTLTVSSGSSGSWTGIDIGSVGLAGSDSYNSSTGVYTISGSGTDIFSTADAFHYVYQTLGGDGQLIARVATITNYTTTWAKVGLMLRQSTAAGDITALLVATAGNGIDFFQRTTLNGTMTSSHQTSTSTAPYWLKVVKAGTVITFYQSPDGATWTQAAQTTLTSLTSPVDIGFAVCSHDNTTLCTGTFDNISLTGGSGGAAPVITSSTTASGSVGTAFSYAIAASNGPTSYSVTAGLPSTLSLNSSTGVISGTPTATGTYAVTISATNSSGTGTASFNLTIGSAPPVTSGLTAWFKADSGVTTSSGSVIQWNDFSINQYNVTQSSGPTAPTLTTDPVTSKPVLHFNGSQWIDSNATLSSVNDVTIITVSSTPNPGVAEAMINIGAGYNSTTTRALAYSDGNQAFVNGSPTAQATFYEGGAASTSANLTLNTVTYLNSSHQAAFYSNGISNGTASVTSSAVTAGLSLGSLMTYTSYYGLTGNIAEVFIYNRVLSSTERQQVENYLATKYSIPPVINSALTGSATTGVAFSYPILASDSPTSYAATGLPNGLSINTTTGVISGTPTTSGTSTITISATNLGGTNTATLTLTTSAGGIPVIQGGNNVYGTVGQPFNYTITATNSPTGYGATGLPAGLSVSSGKITGTPTGTGTSTITLSSTNGSGTTTKTVSLTINPNLSVLSGLTAWFRAESGVTTSAGNVTQWNDQSGHGYNLAPIAGVNKPTVSTDLSSGAPVLSFDGTDALETNSTLTGVNDVTIFAVASTVDFGNTHSLVIVGDATTTNPTSRAFSYQFDYTPGHQGFFQSFYNGASFAHSPTGQAPTTTELDVSSMTYAQSTGTATFYFNGTGIGTATVSSSAISNSLTIGSLLNYTSYLGWDGSIAEVLVYNGALSSANRQQVELYLANKYLTYAPGAAWISAYSSDAQTQINTNRWSKVQADQYVQLLQTLPFAAGLTGWYKADSTFLPNDLANPGTTTWHDSSINHNDLTQPNPVSQPTLTTDPLSGQPEVNFVGSEDHGTGQYLYAANSQVLAGGNDTTVMVVASDSTPSRDATLVTVGGFGNGSERIFRIGGDGNQVYDDTLAVVEGGQAQVGTTVTVNADGTRSVNSATLNVSTMTYNYSQAPQGVSFYSEGKVNGIPQVVSAALSPGLALGTSSAGSAYLPLNGNIAEVLIFNQVLSTTQRQQLEMYLVNKYKLAYSIAAPTITPNGATATSSQVVSLSGAPAPAVIRYTLDGSNPTSTSSLYTGSLTLTQSAPLTCAFFLNNVQISPTSTAQFYVGDSGSIGISDTWQMHYYGHTGINPSQVLASGLTNLQAYLWGYDPTMYSTNGDGLSDLENYVLGFSATNIDINNYGLTNAQQLALGLDPFGTNNPAPTASPPPDPNDHTAPVITLINPPGAVQVP